MVGGELKNSEKRAPLLKRVLAFILDAIIINFVIIFPFRSYFEREVGTINFNDTFSILMNNTEFDKALYLTTFIILVSSLFYWSVLEYKFGQTIGKMILRIKVKSDIKTKSIWQYILRNLSKVVSIIFIFDIIILLFNKEGKRLFEVLSKTSVIEDKK